MLTYEANRHRVRLTVWDGIKPVGQAQPLGIDTAEGVASDGHDLQALETLPSRAGAAPRGGVWQSTFFFL